MARREIIIKIPPLARRDLDKFLEKLSKAIYGDTVIANMEGDTIKLVIFGSNLTIKQTVRNIRMLLKEYKSPSTREGRAYSLRMLSREAKTALPPDVLAIVLQFWGYPARVEDDSIVTSADEETVIEAARLVAKAIWDLASVPASRTVKKALAAVLALHPEVPVSRAVRLLVETGGAYYSEEGKLVPGRDWREALKEVLSVLEGSRE